MSYLEGSIHTSENKEIIGQADIVDDHVQWRVVEQVTVDAIHRKKVTWLRNEKVRYKHIYKIKVSSNPQSEAKSIGCGAQR